MARNSFVFYDSFFQAASNLPEECQIQMFKAICKYGLEQTEPEFTGEYYIFLDAIWATIKPQIDANYRRLLNGQKGGCPKGTAKPAMVGNQNARKHFETKPNQNQNETNTKPNVNVNANDNVNGNVIVGVKGKHNKTKPFNIPTIEEVADFIRMNALNVDAERFISYYQSNGWMVGRNRMKDWKAAIRTWNNKNNINYGISSNRFSAGINQCDAAAAEAMQRITINEHTGH